MQFNTLSLTMLFSALISLLLTVYVFRRRKNPSMLSFSLLLVAVTIWTAGYSLELASSNLQHMKFSTTFAYVGIATIPVFWLLFVARYSGNDGWLTPIKKGLLFLIPVISIILVATNDLHYLFYSSYEMGFLGEISFLKTDAGIFWWIHVIYSYLLILFGLWFLVSMYYKVDKFNRFPVGMFIAASLLPYVANIAYVAVFKPYGILDFTPIAFILMAMILIYGDTNKRAMDVTPLAYDLLFNNIPDSILVLDTQGRIINSNPAAKKLMDQELSIGANRGVGPFNAALTAQLAARNEGSEILVGEKTYYISNTKISSPGGLALGHLIWLQDITERKIIEQQLELLSFSDQLTGLYNRRYFENELKRLDLSREHPIVVISADLDGLKLINDNFGHAEGDLYLKSGANLLKGALRASDILARVGGDEFALLLPRTSETDAQSFIGRVYQEIVAYNREHDSPPLRISMGLGISNNADFPLADAFKRADQNMYLDKLQKDKRNLS